ncbi:putative endoplasmic reticulum mannosyl-oligosaccharide 1,2-alpha-mannosidase-like [Apostichopus japonicus]|uniref:alpha-1,2-Mannosidase n=1 Tax=Stichopus japonicus TaxID=307972 RepID=A0A2G8KM46_STIJA|nr:putative endoplasmic reticulum mannosyl-oligosaccharide 1,2-alpha-mannosidase-like [Apostichopus japonicus]
MRKHLGHFDYFIVTERRIRCATVVMQWGGAQAAGMAREGKYSTDRGRPLDFGHKCWNGLSRLQRRIVLVVIIVAGISVVYITPHMRDTFLSDFKEGEENEEFVEIDPGDFKKRAENEIKKIKQRPPKKGPPVGMKHSEKENEDSVKLEMDEGEENVQDMHLQMEQEIDKRHQEGIQQLGLGGKDELPAAQLEVPDEVDDAINVESDQQVQVPKAVMEIEDDAAAVPGNCRGPKNERQQAVVDAFLHAWKAYKEYAWGQDELHPISRRPGTWFNLGLTLVDALDTMYIMGLTKEFQEARNWVANSMVIQQAKDVNLFETTIRVLGGLLSTYHLSGDDVFLNKAIELGDALLPAFNSDSKIPFADVNLKTGKAQPPKWGPDSSVSEVTTIQLEFRDLTFTTGNPKYKDAVDRCRRTCTTAEGGRPGSYFH